MVWQRPVAECAEILSHQHPTKNRSIRTLLAWGDRIVATCGFVVGRVGWQYEPILRTLHPQHLTISLAPSLFVSIYYIIYLYL